MGIGAAVALVLSVPPAAVGLEPTASKRLARIRAAGPDASLAEVLRSVGSSPNAGFYHGSVPFGTAPRQATSKLEAVDSDALRPSALGLENREVLMLHWDATPAPLQHGLILLGRRPELPVSIGQWLIDWADQLWGTDSHTLALATSKGWEAVSGTSLDMGDFLDFHLPCGTP